MPEGPEVYYFALQIYNLLYQHKITQIKILGGKYLKKAFKNYNLLKKILPSKILSISTLGKILLIELKLNYFLVVTFGMTGFMTTDNIKHNHIEFIINNEKSLFYNDMRNFGNIYLLTDNILYEKIKDIGLDILKRNFTYKLFKQHLFEYVNKYPLSLKKEICLILLDQTFLSGIGNYLRSEILYYAKINPYTKLKNIINNKTSVKILYKNIYNVSRYYASILIEQNLPKKNLPKYLLNDIKENLKYKLRKTPEKYGRVYMVYGEKFDINNKIIKKDKFKKRSIYYV